MKLLAIEQSTSVGSIALLDDTRVLSEESWTETRGRAGNLFEMLPRILEAASRTVADIDLFAIGLGPGSFSGLRTSLSAVNHLALPGRKPVLGIPSAQALAHRLMAEESADS
ncbi:tRNA (adenosine(37)-N6)-threonylcarbamoyltransferase complex dimerization subunit type 1 TsaB, partial [Verrucomicrobiota bacterium]